MSKGYDVDDILREIQEKKRARNGFDAAAPAPAPKPAPVQRPAAPAPAPKPALAQRPAAPAADSGFGRMAGEEAAPVRRPAPAPVQPAKPAVSQDTFVINWPEEEPVVRPEEPAPFADPQEVTRVDLPVQERHFGSRVMADEFGGGGLEPQAGDKIYEEDFGGYDDDMLEYRKPADARTVWQDLVAQRTGLLVRILVTGLFAVLLLYLALSYEYPLPLPAFLWPETHIRTYFIVNLVLTLAAVLTNANTVGGGLASLFTLKADNDSFAATASLASLIQAVALVAAPDRFVGAGLHFYTPVAVLILLFNAIGKIGLSGRVVRNFRTVAGERRAHCATMMVTNKELAREMTRGQNLDYPQIVYPVRTGFHSNFLELSYEEDYSDGVARVLAPVSLAACLLMALVSFLFSRSLFSALAVFAAAACICAPFGAQLVGNIPLNRLSRTLSQENAMVSGYSAVERLSWANAVALRCSDLFPAESITLHRIKTFQKTAPDEAIIDAASVICSCESTLGGIFRQMVGGRTDILKPVENLVCEDGMGLSAWVSGKRVLIGNRELMHQHGIELPSREFEAQLKADGSNLLYLANSGELTAVYVLSYGCSPDVAEALEELADRDMTLVVYTTDPNVTPTLIQDVLGYPAELVKILPAKLHGTFEEMTRPCESCRAYAAHDGSVDQFIRTITTAENCRSAVTFGTVLQMIFVIIGFALVTFMAFMQNMSVISWMLVALFQLVCCALVCLLPNMRRL